ncbi:hypothetical protein [Rhodococcus opacus]|uniref:Uncharacterized protein n=1 Tax=Rhodococcus opacus (strain B4) TaxID=632772 RepID=C1ARM9_RHOOB|nr:hypothetical protein [Rhodococcus opacus]BAH48706.1 hypothetical protein ROP_04590 [Rhodococcus opacus B4]
MRPSDRIPASVFDDVREYARTPAVAWLRRAAVALLALIVAFGAVGLLGVRSGTAYAEGGGYALTLTYPRVARAGLDVPWDLTVRKPGGFSEPVVIVVDSDYFDMFETQGWTPEPSAETSDALRTYMTVDPPPGDTLTLGFDAYIQPSSQLGHSGSVSVSEKGVDVATLEFTTWLVP